MRVVRDDRAEGEAVALDAGDLHWSVAPGESAKTLLISVMRHGLAVAGRYLVVRSRVPDRPGELAKLLTLLANERVNVVAVDHQRETADLPVGDTGVELTLVTRDSAHCDEILATMARLGYPAERLT